MIDYTLSDYERELASYSYLMTILTSIISLPLPFVPVLTSVIYYLSNRRSTYFVRWHSIQTLLAQIPQCVLNSVLFGWTMSILFGGIYLSNAYFAFLFTVLGFNLVDLVATIHTLLAVHRGKHVEWVVYAPLTHLFCKK